jgi:surface antigen
MVGSLRFAAAAAFALMLTACASAPQYGSAPEYPDAARATARALEQSWAEGARIETPDTPLQCVTFARARSGINIHGDAGDWWDLAAGHYAREGEPRLGAVLVLTGYAGQHRGHLAVVTAMDGPRQIRVDHANWLNDGRVYRNDPVVDVSPDNDWSEVRVWDERDRVLGSRTYLVRGFIGPGRDDSDARVASRD